MTITTSRVTQHQTPDVLDLFGTDGQKGTPYELPAGTPLAMVEMGHGLLVYLDPAGEGHGVITDIRDGIPDGLELVTVITTLALWRQANPQENR